MALINTIKELKSFVGGGANVSIDINNLIPIQKDVVRDYLEIWLSQEQYDDLENNINSADAKIQALLLRVRRPIALLTMYEYAKIGGIQFGEEGLFRIETDNQKSVYKYQEQGYRDFMLHHGHEAIEQMVLFLDKKEVDYPIWRASEAFGRSRALMLNYAREFREAHANDISRYTFEIIRPLIEDLEYFTILPSIGQALFDVMKTGILQNNLSAKQKVLLKFIQKALSNFAIEEGSRRQWVRIEGKNVVQSERLEPQSIEKQASAKGSALSVKLRHQEEWGNRYISYIKKYITDNIADFPEYQLWLDEQAAIEEEEATLLDCGCEEGDCSCDDDQCKKVILL